MIDYSLSPYATGTTDPIAAEEERKRREREAIAARMDAEAMANPIAPVEPTPIKETRTIDPATGETTIKIEGKESDLSAANSKTPTLSTAKAPVSPQQFNQQQYNANIGAQESGNRPNIGYHDRSKGTAYGQYGITDAAYQDARKVNPSLPQDKTQATAEQQTQAMNAVTANNAKYLQSYGIQPNQNTLAAAHFLGAKGLNDFMTKKDEQGRPYISPQAQAANGGYDKAASIANARLGGQAAAASGATNMPMAMPGQGVAVATGQGVQGTTSLPSDRPVSPEQVAQQPMPSNQGIRIPGATPTNQTTQQPTPLQMGIERFQTNQDNLDELVKMRNDTNVPEHIRKRSADRAYELMSQEYNKAKGDANAKTMIENGDQLSVAKAISSKPRDEEGSWLKLALLGFISPQLAGAEAIKLGLGPTKWEQATYADKDGNDVAVEIKRRSDGKILGGTKMDGTPLTAEELNLAGGALGSKLSLVGGTYVNDKTGEVGTVVRDEKTGRSWVQTDKGKKPLEGFRPQSSTGTALDQRNKLIQEMNIKTQGKAIEEAMAIQRDYNKLLVGQGLAPLQPSDTPVNAPQIATGQPVQGQAQVAPPGAVAPQGQAQGATVQAPVAPAQATTAGKRPTASEIAATAEKQKQEAQEVGTDLGKVRVGYNKSVDGATRLIKQAQELITDPGFEVSVGFSAQPFFQNIPGSDRATWSAKHQEVVGQTFSLAIENLKGLGAMSDKEGDAATAAISRLKNTDQNEASYKAAVKELQSLIKRGVERNAEKLGKEKPDWDALMKADTPEAGGGTTASGNKFKKVQ